MKEPDLPVPVSDEDRDYAVDKFIKEANCCKILISPVFRKYRIFFF
jgi:hypothetical protein